ncbi:hypothetical protein [Dolichospermum circinale]|uniref:hypothetical protein n=1 Tax=Dolichospermum circinale TaxID=109265 RepID=UPI00232FD95F|nr:hypothetical protein [Dolichospermum circinale]MDB9474356.1 hypothetical protein [Dolichospermum circinale CS-537/11]MDB9478689.1 hypothetical protein [Dolichospermum circinale CS-537/03]MDB9484473.1 hypothetical protein [Dolichospermum circinale CS-537/05]
MSDDFNKPLADEIWASDTVIHEFQLSPDFPIAKYSTSRCYEVQEPHPQPPPRKRGGGLRCTS